MKKIMLFLFTAFLFGSFLLNLDSAQKIPTIGAIQIDLNAWSSLTTMAKFIFFGVIAIFVVKWAVIFLYIISAFGLFKK